MTRELEFRAWDKLKKKVQDVAAINFVEGYATLWKHIGSSRSTYLAELNSLELLEFTGLLDKNKKKIFEGDILKTTSKRVLGMPADRPFERIIKWQGESASFVMSGIKQGYECFFIGMLSEWEVIGNIYENPELLEVMS